MKYYKLIKDLPTFNKNQIFYINHKGELVRKEDNVKIYSKKTLEKFPNILDSQWFKPLYEEFYYINCESDGIGRVHAEFVDDDNSFKESIGNKFDSENEAILALKLLKALKILKDDAKNEKYDAHNEYYYAYYDYELKGWEIVSETSGCFTPNVIYFSLYEDLQKSLDVHKKEWEIVKNYMMKVNNE